MNVRLGAFARRDVADDRQHLAAGVRRVAAFEVARRRIVRRLERELERRRRAAQSRAQACNCSLLGSLRQQVGQFARTGRMRALALDQSGDRADDVADRALRVHKENTVRDRAQQRGVLLLAEAQGIEIARAAQDVTDAVNDQRPVDRLDDEVRRPDVVRLVDRRRIVVPGHHDDRQVRAAGQRANRSACLVAVAVRHLHVEQRDIRKTRGARRDGSVAGGHRLDVEAGVFQCRGCDVAQQRVIIGDQHADRVITHADLRISNCNSSRTRA